MKTKVYNYKMTGHCLSCPAGLIYITGLIHDAFQCTTCKKWFVSFLDSAGADEPEDIEIDIRIIKYDNCKHTEGDMLELECEECIDGK